MVRRLKERSSNNSLDKNTKDIEHIITWVQNIVIFFNSGKSIELFHLRQTLKPFLRTGYWEDLKRKLLSSEHLELYLGIQRHRTQIESIVKGYSDATNDMIYSIPTSVDKKDLEPIIGSEGIESIDWEEDIRILFERHFPGTRGELLPSDIAGFKNILMGEARTRHEYEMRLAEYMANSNLFIKDFCTWMSTTNIG